MHHRLILLLLFLTLGASLVWSQQSNEPPSDDWYLGKPIAGIVFEGLENVAENDLVGVTQPFIGRPFSDPIFTDLQRRLNALDYFEMIIPEAVSTDGTYTAVTLKMNVRERPVIDSIQVNGNSRVRSGDILDAILLKTGDFVTQSRIRLDQEAVQSLYRERGFPAAEVQVTAQPTADSQSRQILRIQVVEGKQTTVRAIRFSGATFVGANTLKGVMRTAEQSLFNAGVFQQSILNQDTVLLERYYRDRGYVDARVVDVQTEFDETEDQTFADITVYIEEGLQWTFGGVSFDGNQIFTDEELSERVRLRNGTTLNQTRLEADFQAVADLYYENGYIYNRIGRTENRDDATRSISYVVSIVELGRAYIENISIRGNTKTDDSVILRELPLEVGDVFSAGRIREGLLNLVNLQYFSSVTPETPEGSAEGLMELVINVEEANTSDIRLGVTFGGNTDFPLAGLVRWQDINFLGLGFTLGAELNLSPIQQRLAFNYLNNWLGGERWSFGIDLSVDHSLVSNEPQDAVGPIFGDGDPNRVPDPFTGHYVFTRAETTYDGLVYPAGAPFPGVPTAAQITEFALQTDYAYAGGSSAIPTANAMTYDNVDLALGLSTGYRFRTLAGSLAFNTFLRFGLGYIDYDAAVYRPFDPVLRSSHQQFSLINRLGFTIALDGRDYFLSPSSGHYLSQGLTFVGGFLFGNRHYIRTDTRLQGYLTLVDIPVFDDWNWKVVLAANSALSLLWPTFFIPETAGQAFEASPANPIAGPELVRTDFMSIARGWPERRGEALWENWFEIRMPIVEQVVWLDSFFDAVRVTAEREDIFGGETTDWMFGFGVGLRFTIPQFPIRLYLAKLFDVVDGAVRWQPGSLFSSPDDPTSGLTFVLSFGNLF